MAAQQHPSDDFLNQGGVPETLTVRVPHSVKGLFKDGATILDADTYCEVVPIAGANIVRLRGKLTCGGTMSFRYRRPPKNAGGNAATAYDSSLEIPHANVAVVANTEFLVDIEPVGEPWLAITFDPSATGVVTFLDVMAA